MRPDPDFARHIPQAMNPQMDHEPVNTSSSALNQGRGHRRLYDRPQRRVGHNAPPGGPVYVFLTRLVTWAAVVIIAWYALSALAMIIGTTDALPVVGGALVDLINALRAK